jgi:hypothetical protein
MDTKKKEEALLMLLQVLNKACGAMYYIAQGLNSEQKNLLDAVNDTVLGAITLVQDVLMQDKKDDLLVNKLQAEFAQVLEFLSENMLMAEFIKHKSKYDE